MHWKSVNKKAKSKNIQRFLHQSLEHIQLSFQVMQSGCKKKTTSKQVSKDKGQQVKAQKQLFQVLINLYQFWSVLKNKKVLQQLFTK